jgi:uncharacterized protein YndB with AHSA1/START domain
MTTDIAQRHDITAFEIRQEIEITAPIEIAFQAVLDELGPEGHMPNGQSLSLTIEPWPGGRWYRDLGNHTGHLWGHVQVIKPPTLLELTGPMPMSYAAANFVQYRGKRQNSPHVFAQRDGPHSARASRWNGGRLGEMARSDSRTCRKGASLSEHHDKRPPEDRPQRHALSWRIVTK